MPEIELIEHDYDNGKKCPMCRFRSTTLYTLGDEAEDCASCASCTLQLIDNEAD